MSPHLILWSVILSRKQKQKMTEGGHHRQHRQRKKPVLFVDTVQKKEEDLFEACFQISSKHSNTPVSSTAQDRLNPWKLNASPATPVSAKTPAFGTYKGTEDPVSYMLELAKTKLNYENIDGLVHLYHILAACDYINKYRENYTKQGVREESLHLCMKRACHPMSLIDCTGITSNEPLFAKLYSDPSGVKSNVFLCHYDKLHVCTVDQCKEYVYDSSAFLDVCPISGFQYETFAQPIEHGPSDDNPAPASKSRGTNFYGSKFKDKNNGRLSHTATDGVSKIGRSNPSSFKKSAMVVRTEQGGTLSLDAPVEKKGKKRKRQEVFESEDDGVSEWDRDTTSMYADENDNFVPRSGESWGEYCDTPLTERIDSNPWRNCGYDQDRLVINEQELRSSAVENPFARMALNAMIQFGRISGNLEDVPEQIPQPQAPEVYRRRICNVSLLSQIGYDWRRSRDKLVAAVDELLHFRRGFDEDEEEPSFYMNDVYLSDIRRHLAYHCCQIIPSMLDELENTGKVPSRNLTKSKRPLSGHPKGISLTHGLLTRRKRSRSGAGSRTALGDRKYKRQRHEKHHNLGINQPSSSSSGPVRSLDATASKSILSKEDKEFERILNIVDRLPDQSICALSNAHLWMKHLVTLIERGELEVPRAPDIDPDAITWGEYSPHDPDLYEKNARYSDITMAVGNYATSQNISNNFIGEKPGKGTAKIQDEMHYIFFLRTEPFLSMLREAKKNHYSLGPLDRQYLLNLELERGYVYREFVEEAFPIIRTLCPGAERLKIELPAIVDLCREKYRRLKQRHRDCCDHGVIPNATLMKQDTYFDPMSYKHILHDSISDYEIYHIIDEMFHFWEICKNSPYIQEHGMQRLKLRNHCVAMLYLMVIGLPIQGRLVIHVHPKFTQRGFLPDLNSIRKFGSTRSQCSVGINILLRCLFSHIAINPIHTVLFHKARPGIEYFKYSQEARTDTNDSHEEIAEEEIE